MSLTNTQYAAVMRMYDDIHTHNAAIQNERYKEVTSLCPQYQTIEDEIISLSMQEAAKRNGNDSSDTNTDEFNERLQSLIKQKAVLLASIGSHLIILTIFIHAKMSGYRIYQRHQMFML